MTILPNWHPILVHFSIALLSVSVVLFMISYFISDLYVKGRYTIVAQWNFWIGATITVLTVLAGWYAYNTVAHDTPSHIAMTTHRNWALATLVWLVVLSIWLAILKRRGQQPTRFLLTGFGVLFIILSITGWLGGELVYRYGLGVMSLPTAESANHDHGNHPHALSDEQSNAKRNQPVQDHDADTASSSSSDFHNMGHSESHSPHDHNLPVSPTADQTFSNPQKHDEVNAHAH